MGVSSGDEKTEISVLDKEICPVCNLKELVLTERVTEVPFFGKVFLYSMTCESCKYHRADVETAEHHDPVSIKFVLESEKDLTVRVVKSSEATIKIPHMITVTPGIGSQGFVSNIEGILNRVKRAIQIAHDGEEDEETKKKAKNHLKKIQRAIWGQEPMIIIIDDPSGNSAIISDKAETRRLK